MIKNECRYCKKEIDSGVKRCPHCRTWQNKWFNQTNLHIMLAVVFFHAFLLGTIILAGILVRVFEGEEENTQEVKDEKVEEKEPPYDELKILDSRLQEYKCKERTCVAIFGTIDNPTEHIWGNLYFHVEFKDQSNKIIDVLEYVESEIILRPESKSSFRIEGMKIAEEQSYSNYGIEIRRGSPKKCYCR